MEESVSEVMRQREHGPERLLEIYHRICFVFCSLYMSINSLVSRKYYWVNEGLDKRLFSLQPLLLSQTKSRINTQHILLTKLFTQQYVYEAILKGKFICLLYLYRLFGM